MEPTDPIAWEFLVEVRSEPRLREVFEAHREEVADADTVQAAVDQFKELVRDDPAFGSPIQGVAYVFAYLLEAEAGWEPGATFVAETSVPPSLAERRPDDAELERLFLEEERVPWWLAVRYGVHYTLVIYWLWEADVPLLRRNLPDSQFEQLDLDER